MPNNIILATLDYVTMLYVYVCKKSYNCSPTLNKSSKNWNSKYGKTARQAKRSIVIEWIFEKNFEEFSDFKTFYIRMSTLYEFYFKTHKVGVAISTYTSTFVLR